MDSPRIPLENQPPWLEVVAGDAPLLLIAPHGGRAGPAAFATLHPKVNDLETAAITRELADRFGATALINFGMDRNELDCNRIAQLLVQGNWLLTAIADQIDRLLTLHQTATVLLIHGWNIIEPRIDFGFGLKESNGRLRPPRGAHLSASDNFIRLVATDLAPRLREAGILPTFGLRYPGGGAQNLLQAFTPRHAHSESHALCRLAALATDGRIDALQLELSVALRLAGSLRRKAVDAIVKTFDHPAKLAPSTPSIAIDRVSQPASPKKPANDAPMQPPLRIGIEFYDPVARLGGMASFDIGSNSAGGRIMMLFQHRRVALFTGEGPTTRTDAGLALGPLSLEAQLNTGQLRFQGPAVVVDDGAAYLSVEGALASGRLDAQMEIDAVLEFSAGTPLLEELLADNGSAAAAAGHWAQMRQADHDMSAPTARFGRLKGSARFDGRLCRLDAIARVGLSFAGLGIHKFSTRRMIWAVVGDPKGSAALEVRELEFDHAPVRRSAHLLSDQRWRSAEVRAVNLTTASPITTPESIGASIRDGPRLIAMTGAPDTFMTLSRPGPDNTRIHTSLGFARYQIDGTEGAGMYEYSRSVGGAPVDPAGDAEE